MRHEPRVGRDIRDREIASQVFRFAEALVDHAVDALGLVGVAVDRVLEFLGRIPAEMMRLAEHRADTRHLEHQPLDDVVLSARVRRHQLAGLLGQVHQDRARLENRDRLAARSFGIGHRGHAIVGADFQELGLELIAGADIDRDYVVLEADLLEHPGDLVAVGRRPEI